MPSSAEMLSELAGRSYRGRDIIRVRSEFARAKAQGRFKWGEDFSIDVRDTRLLNDNEYVLSLMNYNRKKFEQALREANADVFGKHREVKMDIGGAVRAQYKCYSVFPGLQNTATVVNEQGFAGLNISSMQSGLYLAMWACDGRWDWEVNQRGMSEVGKAIMQYEQTDFNY